MSIIMIMLSHLIMMFRGGFDSPPSRREDAIPCEHDKKIAVVGVPTKFRADVNVLKELFEEKFVAGLSINWTLQQALETLPRNRKRVDSYDSLRKFLKQNLGIELNINSNKTKKDE